VAFEGAGITYRAYTELSDDRIELIPTSDEIERLRWVKEAGEIDLLRAAQAVADEGFEFITSKLAPGMTEKEVALELDVFMLGRADGLSFDTIVGFGENAAEPHHSPTSRPLSRGDIVKMDFGAEVGGYHSDMTRTVAFGPISPLLQEVYEVVCKAQQAGVDAIRAGITGGEADRVVREIISDSGYADAYKHGLGHGVGLEIHEGPSLRNQGQDVVPEGAVVTIEPGVYLAGVGGVRIEDMVEVTADGCRVVPSTTKELVVL
jgi:Xaa-Pro aminopeptidase